MADPQTTNLGVYIPTRGSDSGTWDVPLNANAEVMDSMASYVTTISLSGGGTSVTLTTPPYPWAGPYQSQAAVLKFTGVLSNNVTINLTRPGFWIIDGISLNPATFHALLVGPSAPTFSVCVIPGQVIQIYCDGANTFYVGLPPVGSYLDLAATSVPAWITASTPPPYVNCDGSVLNATQQGWYPILVSMIGTTLPDSKGRTRFTLSQGSGRITLNSGLGIDGTTLLAGGGSQTMDSTGGVARQLPAVTFAWTASNSYSPFAGFASYNLTVSTSNAIQTSVTAGGGTAGVNDSGSATTQLSGYTPTGSAASGGLGLPLLPPGYVGGLTLIRAG